MTVQQTQTSEVSKTSEVCCEDRLPSINHVLSQPAHKEGIVLFFKKDVGTVVAAIVNVVIVTRDQRSCSAWHREEPSRLPKSPRLRKSDDDATSW